MVSTKEKVTMRERYDGMFSRVVGMWLALPAEQHAIVLRSRA